MDEVIIKHYTFKIPTIIITTDIHLTEEYKQECLDSIYALGDKMNRITNLKADMSTYAVYNETKVLDSLLHRINTAAFHCTWANHEAYGYDLEDVWSGVYKKGDHAVSHWHHPASISFCYYLKADPEKSAPLIFDDTEMRVNPYDGLLVFFPGHLLHSVPEQTVEDTRVVIAGNYKQVDKKHD